MSFACPACPSALQAQSQPAPPWKTSCTTRDLDQGGNDGPSLTVGEAANLLINGTLITTVVPQMRATQLVTDAGSVTVLVFSVGANNYALAPFNINIPANAHTTAPASLNVGPGTSISPIQYGLQPKDANTCSATIFPTESFGSQVLSSGIGTINLLDTDLVRGNGATLAQEVLTNLVNAFNCAASDYSQSLTTLQLNDGTVRGAVQTLQVITNLFYGSSNASYFFDKAALSASGHMFADVATGLGSVAVDHNLRSATPSISARSSMAVATACLRLPSISVINGTARADVLVGTTGQNAIRGFDGNDKLAGNGDRDAYIIGTDSRSGTRSTYYHASKVVVALMAGVAVKSITDNGSAMVITLVGDLDRILACGAALNISDKTFQETSGSFTTFV